jgi:nitroreductase
MNAAAAAIYILLLAAHARGLAGYWRTPEVLRTQAGRDAVSVPDGERILGLVYLGHPCQDREPPPREPSETYVTYLA